VAFLENLLCCPLMPINKMTPDNMHIDVISFCLFGEFRNLTYVMWHFNKQCFFSFLMSVNKNDFKQDAYGCNAMLPARCILKCLACGIFTFSLFKINKQNYTIQHAYRCNDMLPVWGI
jgi:hypothetical protein